MSEGLSGKRKRRGTLVWLFLAAGIVVTFLWLALWASSTFEACIHAAQSEAPKQENYQGQSLFLFLLGRWVGCAGRWAEVNDAPIEAAATAITGLFTIVLAFSTIGLWRETERLAVGADDQAIKMVESIKASNTLAGHTETLANDAKVHAEMELRAYVGVKEATFEAGKFFATETGSGTGTRLSAVIAVNNFGKTPAYELTSWAMREFRRDRNQPELKSPEGQHAIKYLPPSGGTTHTVIFDVDISDYRLLQSGDAKFWVWGEVRYLDAFGKHQETDFLLFVGGETKLDFGGYMALAKTGNRAT